MDVPETTAPAFVLVVDDDPFVRRIVGDRLEANGLLVETAADGATAIEQVGRRAPDAIVLDLNLPDAQGLGLLPVLSGLAPQTPILILTGTDDAAFVRAALGAGAHDYLTKPWVDEVLVARVGAAARLGQSVRALTLANQQLRRLADVDELTGLANRRALRGRLEDLLAGAERGGASFGVVVIDLDGITLLNAREGHAAGDRALAAAADALLGVCRRGDQVGRWAGDEFLALVTYAGEAELAVAAERYAAAISPRLGGIGVAAGRAGWERGDSVTSLVARAEAALRAQDR